MERESLYPTKPAEGLVSSAQIDDKTRKYAEQCSQAIHELVYVGTYFLKWEVESERGTYHEKLATTAFFRRILQLLDAIALQIREGAVETCEIHMRSLIETGFSFVHLIKDDPEKRSLAYFLYEYNKRRNLLIKYNPLTNAKFDKLNETYRTKGFVVKKIGPVSDVDKKLAEYEASINEPIFDFLRGDFEKKKNKSNLKWYHLGTDLDGVRQLAESVGRFELYDGVYQNYNNAVHGTDVMSEAFDVIEDKYHIKPIRIFDRIKEVSVFAIQLGILSFRDIMMYRFTGEQREEAHYRVGRYDIQHYRKISGSPKMELFF